MGSHYEGAAFAYPKDPKYPPLFAAVRTPDKSDSFRATLRPLPIGPDGLVKPLTWLTEYYPEITLGSDLETEWHFSSDKLRLTWKSNIGTSGHAEIPASQASLPSTYLPEPEITNWDQFREFAVKLEPNRFIFRGQESNSWRLRTHFHRSGRYHLMRFMNEDISTLHANLSSLTDHIFNLNDPLQNAAFYSLIQHHGYPTPLLDWSFSPFIGAFFAYRNLLAGRRTENSKVRIFILDTAWNRDLTRVQLISPAPPHFSFVNPIAINNTRMVPQQAMSTVTNIDDIETYIRHWEQRNSTNYLRVVDLPSLDRPQVMQELALMGITAGSMFPGLDGACEQLKERYFNR
nr:FRG domain-containing protein [Rhodopseudomonas palustris]